MGHLSHAALAADGRDIVAALLEGGDSRIALDPGSGANKYLCPPLPAPDLACLASCTASPIGPAGLTDALRVFHEFADAPSPQSRQQILGAQQDRIVQVVEATFGIEGMAQVHLCPSGTDALLTVARMLAAERPGSPLTAILPAAGETGTGVPLAVTCRRFDGPAAGTALAPGIMRAIEIPLRDADGVPRDAGEVNDAFSNAAACLPGRAIVTLTHGTKTGLIAPVAPRVGEDVIVDACQGRIAPGEVASYLVRGWPVVVTGSKFFGGPPFSGAVLFPLDRLPRAAPAPRPASLGTVLRWTASLATMAAFAARPDMRDVLAARMARLVERLGRMPGVVPIPGLSSSGDGWSDLASIFTFALHNPERPRQLLPATALRRTWRAAAAAGVLVGQPVELPAFAGLRVALGARDLLAADESATRRDESALARLEHILHQAQVRPASCVAA